MFDSCRITRVLLIVAQVNLSYSWVEYVLAEREIGVKQFVFETVHDCQWQGRLVDRLGLHVFVLKVKHCYVCICIFMPFWENDTKNTETTQSHTQWFEPRISGDVATPSPPPPPPLLCIYCWWGSHHIVIDVCASDLLYCVISLLVLYHYCKTVSNVLHSWFITSSNECILVSSSWVII